VIDVVNSTGSSTDGCRDVVSRLCLATARRRRLNDANLHWENRHLPDRRCTTFALICGYFRP